MPKDNQTDPRKLFVVRYLPWVLGGIMFIVYAVTLNHWVTLMNITQVAAVSGWMWQPQIYNPLSFLATLPFRIIPVADVPIAMNLLSAAFAAATLGILARSVALLPHDRTEMERLRERSDFSFLTGWVAWIPPIATVIFIGFQFTFWEHATSFTNESLQLLWASVIIWQLLEYRLDELEIRLYVAAFLYGSGMADNWALVGFLPVFLVMIIWLRGTSFFNIYFLGRMVLYGVLGLLAFLILPILAKMTQSYPISIWEALKPNLALQWRAVHLISISDVRHCLALISLTSFLPALLMSIRWSSTFGDSSRMGASLVQYLMHLISIIFLGAMSWVLLDPPLSPHALLASTGLPGAGLTFYYVVALCIGYYSGYVLLVFGQPPVPTRRNRRPEGALPKGMMWLCPVITFLTLAGILITTGLLIGKNLRPIQAVNDNSLLKFAENSTHNLPHSRTILLCDSDNPAQNQPIRAYLVQAMLAHQNRALDYPVVDTSSLVWPGYHIYLHKHFPSFWPQTFVTNQTPVTPLQTFTLLKQLSKTNSLYYLNPSYGYYFEQFYQEPHGLVYELKSFSETEVLPPPISQDVVKENDSFWSEVASSAGPQLLADMKPFDPADFPGILGKLMARLHVAAENNPNAIEAGSYYSRGMTTFGVYEQRSGELEKAAGLFKKAIEFNTNNIVAEVNLAFNKDLREGAPLAIDLARTTTDRFGKYHNWNEVLNANGPFDETSFCFENGVWFMQTALMRQAAVLFNRVRQLVPDNLASRLFLAQIYNLYRQPDSALEALHDPLTRPFRFALTEFNSTELNVLAAASYFQKNDNAAAAKLLEAEIKRHPDNDMLLLVSAQAFNMRGMYTNALEVINEKLERTPNDPTWVFGKGYVSLQLGKYDVAITNLSRILESDPTNASALFNRGVAYFQTTRLDAARADFLRFQTLYTNNLQIAYGLGEIAWRKHDTNELVRNYHVIIANAPTNTPDLKLIRERLSQFNVK